MTKRIFDKCMDCAWKCCRHKALAIHNGLREKRGPPLIQSPDEHEFFCWNVVLSLNFANSVNGPLKLQLRQFHEIDIANEHFVVSLVAEANSSRWRVQGIRRGRLSAVVNIVFHQMLVLGGIIPARRANNA